VSGVEQKAPARPSRADIMAWAMDALSAAVDAPDRDAAVVAARERLAALDPAALLRVAGCLAALAAHDFPRRLKRGRSMRRIVDDWRLHISLWSESS
jgi:hypothetical protein